MFTSLFLRDPSRFQAGDLIALYAAKHGKRIRVPALICNLIRDPWLSAAGAAYVPKTGAPWRRSVQLPDDVRERLGIMADRLAPMHGGKPNLSATVALLIASAWARDWLPDHPRDYHGYIRENR